MGNNPSSAIATAGAKHKLNSTMKEINGALGSERDPSTAAKARELAERKKERDAAFLEKQQQRQARKSKLSEQWASHKKSNAEDQPKKGLW